MSGRHRIRTKRASLSPLTVIGELLLACGLIIVGYILWQPWYTGVIVQGEQRQLAAETSQVLRDAAPTAEEVAAWQGETPVAARAAANEVFANMYVPAFGETFVNRIAEGTSRYDVLNVSEKGIGRYETTQMPGEAGNFAVAAHRSGPRTTPFKEVMNLRVGDPIFIETAEGWYTYRYRSLEYVLPHEVDVLSPFPRIEGVPGEDQILTLTTCHPKDFGSDERVIAYAVLESFQPATLGVPAELLELNPSLGGV
ncbi:MAG: class E sortase [Microbacteriaceae bacterium]|nr:class E sortase [Microbacteriaceae bacterium]